MDFDALRRQTLGSGSDEAVTVNTRALIDKVLARYSGEWTTLRELLQNAADAAALKVKITIQTLPSISAPVPISTDRCTSLRHVLQHHTLKSWAIENDGEHFRPVDWARLKKIAEGNPDETKIGAFGVGFYSVFADCEEPFVSSGDEALAFYWKGDSLFTRKLKSQEQSTPTTFLLPMRNDTSPVPPLLSLCQFLAESMTFVGLQTIDLYLDDWLLLHLDKKSAPSAKVNPSKGINLKTSEGLLQISEITKEATQLSATWLKAVEWRREAPSSFQASEGNLTKAKTSGQSFRGFFSKLTSSSNSAVMAKLAREDQLMQAAISEDLLGESQATVFLHMNKAFLRTSVNAKFVAELERATKKPPPKSTAVSLLFTSYDEHVASDSRIASDISATSTVFLNVLPSRGKVFIGFPTNQTTGIRAHLSTPSIIPTVERESIDLNNRFIKTWNVELLRAAGIAARVSWDEQMSTLKQKLSTGLASDRKPDAISHAISKLLPESLFLLDAFSWNETTPASQVGTILEESFWNCSRTMSIDILSSTGVLPAAKVRLAMDSLDFVDGIPMLPKALIETGIVKRLTDHGIITEVTVADVKSQLESKALTPEQLHAFLKWLCYKTYIHEFDAGTIRSLLEVAVANDEERGIIQLGCVQQFINSSRIPPHMPVPSTTIPFKYTKDMKKPDLDSLGWEDLQIVPWLRFLIENTGARGGLSNDQDMTVSADFARNVLQVVSKQWDGLSGSSKASVTQLLSARPIMPTRIGMHKPSEAYFPSVKLFDDLPVVIPMNAVKDKFLLALGVRKTVELGMVFDRLLHVPTGIHGEGTKTAVGKLNHVKLIQYLVSVRKDIPPADIKRLQETPICPAESDEENDFQKWHLVSQLFEPDDTLRRLGLPILYWPEKYIPSSGEGTFLTLLGLSNAPSFQRLVEIMASAGSTGNFASRDRAIKYFVEHHQLNGYAAFRNSFGDVPFLPLQGSEKRLSNPMQCFTNERAALLGFDILREDLHAHASKFGVSHNPSMIECARRLIENPPQTKRDARVVFEYFGERCVDINKDLAATISNSAIVPTLQRAKTNGEKSSQQPSVKHLPPNACFLGDGDQWADVFDYVDFGRSANLFLLHCGSKHEPSTTELAMKVVREPARLYSLLDAPRYIDLLRKLAGSWQVLKKNKTLVADMRKSPFLFAYREISSSKPVPTQFENEEDTSIKAGELASADRIIIVDDMISYHQFKEHLLAAPMEEALEELYIALGSKLLTDIVDEQHKIGSIIQDHKDAQTLHQLVVERVRLFLHDYPRIEIRHDAKWVEKNLRVVVVANLALRKSLRNTHISHKFSRKAVVSYDRQQDYILYVTSGPFDFFEISQGLVTYLLCRSKPQSTMMLEMLLESDLMKLRRKGYNVDRILRQKAAEARVAEDQRKEAIQHEQEQIRLQEQQFKELEDLRRRELNMFPGAFPDSPNTKHDGHAPETSEDTTNNTTDGFQSRSSGLFSQLRRNLGIHRPSKSPLRNTNERNSDLKPAIRDTPPAYSERDPRTPDLPPQPEHATAPHQLRQNLVSAIQSSHAHNSSSLTSQPTYNEVKETHSYCDATPATNITSIGETSRPAVARVFLSSDLLRPPYNQTPSTFLALHGPALNLFAQILFSCAETFSLDRSAVHIFYDAAGSTIAFNQSKALFFNHRYFEDLHLETCRHEDTAAATVYWSITMAHELAHNIVADHSAAHSYYMEAMIVQYFGRLADKVIQGRVEGPKAVPDEMMPGGQGNSGDGGGARLVDVD